MTEKLRSVAKGEIGLQVSVMRCCICGNSGEAITQVPISAAPDTGGGTYGVAYICLACINAQRVTMHTVCNIGIESQPPESDTKGDTVKALPPFVRKGRPGRMIEIGDPDV